MSPGPDQTITVCKGWAATSIVCLGSLSCFFMFSPSSLEASPFPLLLQGQFQPDDQSCGSSQDHLVSRPASDK